MFNCHENINLLVIQKQIWFSLSKIIVCNIIYYNFFIFEDFIYLFLTVFTKKWDLLKQLPFSPHIPQMSLFLQTVVKSVTIFSCEGFLLLSGWSKLLWLGLVVWVIPYEQRRIDWVLVLYFKRCLAQSCLISAKTDKLLSPRGMEADRT